MLYNKTSTLAPDTGRWELFIVLSHQETMLYHLNTILNSRKYFLHYLFGARKRTRPKWIQIYEDAVIQCSKKYKKNSVNKPINNDCY